MSPWRFLVLGCFLFLFACTSACEVDSAGRSGSDTTAAAFGVLRARVDSLEAVVDSLRRASRGEAAPPPETTVTGGEDPPEAQAQRQEPPPRPRPDEVVYETYRNEQLGYSVEYPANVFHPDQELGGENGQAFVSPDRRASLVVYGVRGADPNLLRLMYNKELQNEKHEVTYKTLHDDWFVISGFRDGQVFYERALLRDGVLKSFFIQYDADEKAYFDPITEHISFSFKG